MKHLYLSLAFLLVPPAAVATLRAADVKTELDCSTKTRVFQSHFGRYGYEPKSCIEIQPQGLRFLLPAAEGVGQTGLYSYVALAGDFEVSAVFDWDAVEFPQVGSYGVSCGIAVDALNTGLSVSLARGYLLDKGTGPGYVVNRGEPGEKGTKYDRTFHPTKSKSGRLVLRREKKEVICLAADSVQAELRELCRLPFTDVTVRPVRLFADAGGSPTGMDVRLSLIRFRADEIAAGTVKHEQSNVLGWWLAGGGVFIAVTLYLFVRRHQGKWPWRETE